ncbi:hypothetical protein U0070_023034 [Myodes glareolus]|uniref:Uncharacterized protein n=1 Tax=Myodes glareolus TaxID=447135 RepID=A0AAW0HRP5_MYOGA
MDDCNSAPALGPTMEKDFQDIQQLDSEENGHQPSGDEEQGTHGQNPRTENPLWKGKNVKFDSFSSILSTQRFLCPNSYSAQNP